MTRTLEPVQPRPSPVKRSLTGHAQSDLRKWTIVKLIVGLMDRGIILPPTGDA